jgi:hypothetical protein
VVSARFRNRRLFSTVSTSNLHHACVFLNYWRERPIVAPQSFPRWLGVALRLNGAAPIVFFGTVGTVDDASGVPFPETGKAPDEAAERNRFPRLLCFDGSHVSSLNS